MSKNFKPLDKAWLVALMAASLAACGGGGGGDNDPPVGGNPPAPTPAPPPPPPPPPASPTPPLSATVINVTDGRGIGQRYFPNGDTASGGQGAEVNGMPCAATIPRPHTHTHVAIVLNGELLSTPDLIGTPGSPRCYYPVNTLNGTGILHVQSNFSRTLTLGDLFDIWGQPLTTTNVAGLQGMAIEVFVTDNGTVTKVESDWRTIELTSHRNITIGVGTPLTEIPNITWTEPLTD